MSGLEKFQDNAAWRQKLRNHLLSDRPPPPPKPQEESPERRHSWNIVIDFPALIKAKKAQLSAQVEKEEREENISKSALNINMNISRQDNTQPQDADESFNAFEQMCERTASDPDSTLFQYLNSDDKGQVLALAKERSARADKSGDFEMDALRRLMNDVSCQDQLANESPLKSPDCTQLEDIEAPSRLWDNDITINDSPVQPSAKISPVKMVGLLRPSTIIESNEADITDCPSDDSANSFRTAGTLKTSISSSCYETAADNSLTSNAKAEITTSTLNVDDLFYAAIAKAKPHGMSKVEERELLSDLHETLVDLAETQSQSNMDTTVIELSSDDEDEPSKTESIDIKEEEESIMEENKENKSIQFNDTIEEMEYMMQKGLEYMAAAKAGEKSAPSPKHKPNTNTPTNPLSASNVPKQKTFVLSPKKVPSSPQTLLKNVCKPAATVGQSRFAIDLDKPQTKFFKQPSGIPMRRHLKPQKDQFAHIVSPIRAYTQKSGTAPLMSMFRQKENVKDIFNRLSTQELEQEARLCRMKLKQAAAAKDGNFNPLKADIEGIDPKSRLLPKKAYISSDLKQVVDERTPLPMPSVPRIQKYLNAAVEPTVLRHDGKMKLPSGHGAARLSNIPRRPNQSLGDLSLASGDISLYTIKDAQKF